VIAIVVILVAAALLGFLAQRRMLGRHGPDHPLARAEGLPTSELVIPARTLAGLLLAFVLLSVYTSFEGAGTEAAREAGAVLSMAEDAVVLTPAARTDVVAGLQCYARSVIGPDWRSQEDDGAPSPDTDAASDRIAETLRVAAGDQRNGVAIASILADDSLRIQSRIGRLDEGRPSVPMEVWILLIVTVAIMLAGMAALGHPGVRTGTQLGVLVGTTVVFGLTLLVVHDLDRPYGGAAAVQPDAMRTVERRIAAPPGGHTKPPCDAEGRPLAA
jgi:hypothetical protein